MTYRNTRIRLAAAIATWILLASPLWAGQQTAYYFGPAVENPDASTGRYPLANVTVRRADAIRMVPERGTLSVRVIPTGEYAEFSGLLEIYPSCPRTRVSATFKYPRDKETKEIDDRKTLECVFSATLSTLPDGNAYETVSNEKEPVVVKPGEEVSLIWTWSGVEHCLYINGRQVARRVAYSPFPYHFGPDLRLNAGSRENLDIREYAIFNYAMDDEEVARESKRKIGRPPKPTPRDTPNLVAQWAPGEKRFYGMVDAGASLAQQAEKARFTAVGPGNVALGETTVDLRNGFGEVAAPLKTITPGDYCLNVELLNAGGNVVGKATSDTWTLPETKWVGNTIGLTDKIQPPWTPIARQDKKLGVWGREIQLAGGFGLPQQIVSQEEPQLSSPIGLNLIQAGKAIPIDDVKVEIKSAKPHEATWTGTAKAGAVNVSVNGSLEYDGMVLLDVTLEPAGPNTEVNLDGITLDMVMPGSEALFANACTDQGYWWYPKHLAVGKKADWTMTNLDSKPARMNHWFFMLLCNRTTGLEWFADNLNGWAVDEKKPIQELVRQADGSVRFTCKLANKPFTLHGKRTMQFGYMATPVKPLPNDWRSLYVHHHELKGLDSKLGIWWLWGGGWDKYRPNIFSLLPENPEMYAKTVRSDSPIIMAPFTNQHVLTPSGEDATDPERGWPYFHNIATAETENDGWDATPTRIMRDYWAYNIDQWIKRGGMESIYIDEANTQTVGRGLLSGVGYMREDGTRAPGHNTLGMRKQLKRIRQTFLDNGRRPLVWIPVYGKIMPHAFSFVDVVSEGEAFTESFNKPGGPKWMDVWGKGILDELGTHEDPTTGEWLLSICDAQKFGFMPVFLCYIKYYDRPEYRQDLRSYVGILTLLDINTIECSHAWLWKVKEDFGMEADQTSFHRFDVQKELVSENPDVPVSYYRRGDKILAVVANLSDKPYDGAVSVDKDLLRIAKNLEAVRWDEGDQERHSTKVRSEPLMFDQKTFRVNIPPKDFWMVELK